MPFLDLRGEDVKVLLKSSNGVEAYLDALALLHDIMLSGLALGEGTVLPIEDAERLYQEAVQVLRGTEGVHTVASLVGNLSEAISLSGSEQSEEAYAFVQAIVVAHRQLRTAVVRADFSVETEPFTDEEHWVLYWFGQLGLNEVETTRVSGYEPDQVSAALAELVRKAGVPRAGALRSVAADYFFVEEVFGRSGVRPSVVGAYQHINSRGFLYYLNMKEVVLIGGKMQRIYYFSRDIRPESLQELPPDFQVAENPRNGFLTIRRT